MKEQTAVALVALCGSWATISGVIWKFAEKADKVVSTRAQQITADWLQSDNLGPLVGIWADVLAHAFDNVFGKRPLSWRFFRNSCCASVVSVLLVAAIWAAIRPQQFLSFIHQKDLAVNIFSSFLAAGILNFVPDYISLIKGRLIIARLQGTKSPLAAFVLVLGDIVLSAGIGCLALFGLTVAVNAPYGLGVVKVVESIPGSVHGYLHLLIWTVLPMEAYPGYPATGIWFYATFFTSVWVLLHVTSGALIRVGNSIGWISNAMKTLLNVREQPMLSLATIALAIITMFYIGGAAWVLL